VNPRIPTRIERDAVFIQRHKCLVYVVTHAERGPGRAKLTNHASIQYAVCCDRVGFNGNPRNQFVEPTNVFTAKYVLSRGRRSHQSMSRTRRRHDRSTLTAQYSVRIASRRHRRTGVQRWSDLGRSVVLSISADSTAFARPRAVTDGDQLWKVHRGRRRSVSRSNSRTNGGQSSVIRRRRRRILTANSPQRRSLAERRHDGRICSKDVV